MKANDTYMKKPTPSNNVKFAIEILGFSTYPAFVRRLMFRFIYITTLVRRALRRNDISKMDFVITTRCSLKCKHCSNLMQFYGKDTVEAKDCNTETLYADINKLLSITDRIWQLVVVGGEPFMNKDLSKILRHLLSHKKIKHINVITNGTIVPGDELVDVLQNGRIQVTVSDYGEVAKNKDKLLAYLEKNKIKHKVLEALTWVDRGEIKKRGRTREELAGLFNTCISKCTTFMNGKMYNCEIYSNGANLGYIEERADEVIDIRNISKKDFSKALRLLNTRESLHACDYCGEVTYNEKCTVKAGIQM